VRRIDEVQKRGTQEAVMARQFTFAQSFKFVTGIALAGIGLYILSAALASPLAVFTSLLRVAVSEALGQLPSILLVALQAAERFTFDHPRSSPCPLQMLVSCWPLLRVLAGAA
jgi:hypothetical protein